MRTAGAGIADYLRHVLRVRQLVDGRKHEIPPHAIADPGTLDILRGIHIKKALRNAGGLQDVFGSGVERERLRAREIEAARLIVFAIEDSDRNETAGAGMARGPCPLKHGDGPQG
jgi:hypothetical protein